MAFCDECGEPVGLNDSVFTPGGGALCADCRSFLAEEDTCSECGCILDQDDYDGMCRGCNDAWLPLADVLDLLRQAEETQGE